MMHYEEIESEGMVQLNVEGKIDSLNCDEFQNLVLKSFTKTNTVIVNLEAVPYMSSAGLRALIIGEKTAKSKGGKQIIINVQPQVQDVLRVTGFDSILEIR
ncbi:MAG: STAS domain-containing protein [Eubacterium sp.]|nr:STAS domain-containing protein [Eubacterium sp.]